VLEYPRWYVVSAQIGTAATSSSGSDAMAEHANLTIVTAKIPPACKEFTLPSRAQMLQDLTEQDTRSGL